MYHLQNFQFTNALLVRGDHSVLRCPGDNGRHRKQRYSLCYMQTQTVLNRQRSYVRFEPNHSIFDPTIDRCAAIALRASGS